jgi:hypothetical protein
MTERNFHTDRKVKLYTKENERSAGAGAQEIEQGGSSRPVSFEAIQFSEPSAAL